MHLIFSENQALSLDNFICKRVFNIRCRWKDNKGRRTNW
jgi:hypothetical protein